MEVQSTVIIAESRKHWTDITLFDSFHTPTTIYTIVTIIEHVIEAKCVHTCMKPTHSATLVLPHVWVHQGKMKDVATYYPLISDKHLLFFRK